MNIKNNNLNEKISDNNNFTVITNGVCYFFNSSKSSNFGCLLETQQQKKAKFIQRKINIDLGISRKNLLTKSVPNRRICDKPDNHDYCEFIENRVELEKIYR